MESVVLNTVQIIQLASFGPCLFILLYLGFSAKRLKKAILPFLLFVTLSNQFLLPVVAVFPEMPGPLTYSVILYNENLMPIISFLLILQFIIGRTPPFFMWGLLAIPFLGTLTFQYYAPDNAAYCIQDRNCEDVYKVMVMSRVIVVSTIFVTLVPRLQIVLKRVRKNRLSKNRYWLIVMLIVLNLLSLYLDLLLISGQLDEALFQLSKAITNLLFVYLVFTSVFRVFDHMLKIEPPHRASLSTHDKLLVEDMKHYINTARPYLQPSFRRADLADKLRISEQHASFLINQTYNHSFSQTMNELRIKLAKEMLINTDLSVTDIGFDVGFSSITSFNRVFKQITGLSPSQYRKNYVETGKK